MTLTSLCVFCGSASGQKPLYTETAVKLGQSFLKRDIGLVYGGASVGLMGAIADTMLNDGGKVIGVMPQSLVDKEIAHKGLTNLHIVSSMHARKAMMADLSDGFLVMPGGLGTMEEMFEVWTWLQLGIHEKPIGLLNVDHYFDKMLAFLDHVVDQGFLKAEHKNLIQVDPTPEGLIDKLAAFKAPEIKKWGSRKDR